MFVDIFFHFFFYCYCLPYIIFHENAKKGVFKRKTDLSIVIINVLLLTLVN